MSLAHPAAARRPRQRPRHPNPPIRSRQQPTHPRRPAFVGALNISADSLLFDDEERGPKNPTLRLKLEAVDQFTPGEQEHVAAFIEGALLRHHAKQALTGQAS